MNFSNKNKIDLQIELTRYIHIQLKRLNTDGSNVLINCPTLFEGKEAIGKLILGLIAIADTIANAFSLINKIIKVKYFLFFIFQFLSNLNLGNGYFTK